MGKRDASARAPIDQYRKQIGKEQLRRDRKSLRETKERADLKKSGGDSPLRGASFGLVLSFIFLALLAAAYILVYYYLRYQSDTVADAVQAIERFWREQVVVLLPVWLRV